MELVLIVVEESVKLMESDTVYRNKQKSIIIGFIRVCKYFLVVSYVFEAKHIL